MAKAARIEARSALALAGVGALLALALAQGAGARTSDPAATSAASVVGSGTLDRARVAVLERPRAGARRVAVMRQFRTDFRPQYVLALQALEGKNGKPAWYRISVPGRPNGRTGWVRASAVELRPVHKRVLVYRGARRFEYWEGDRLVRSGRVAVGKRGAETPTGLFYVTWKFDPRTDPAWSILGNFAFETSAYSKLTDWPGGGIVGLHGTPWPQLLGQAVSHGCVRLHNRDVEFLRTRVPLGTPIEILR